MSTADDEFEAQALRERLVNLVIEVKALFPSCVEPPQPASGEWRIAFQRLIHELERSQDGISSFVQTPDALLPIFDAIRMAATSVNMLGCLLDPLELLEQLDSLLALLDSSARRGNAKAAPRAQFTIDEISVLRALSSAGRVLKSRDLSERASISESPLRRVLKRLEHLELVVHLSKRGGYALTEAGKTAAGELPDNPKRS